MFINYKFYCLRSVSALFYRCLAFFSAVLLVVFLLSSDAVAKLSGDASLTYSLYDGSADVRRPDGSISRNSMSSNSFVQNYSLLYTSSGPVYNSRVGVYDVALGYNWTALDTTFRSSAQQSESYNETRGHLMYKGEVLIDPKEVPFRLNAFSRDMSRNSVSTSTGSLPQAFPSILGLREQATGINDGLHIETGATLVAGVKNGMTNGYNEILRHFPMILIDYKDTINRDLRATNPIDDHLSRLAFVSLNKKDNWFHYRHTFYEDNLNLINNYVEDEIQLGTVDQYMARRWIDFSNWLKVSTDMLISKRKSNLQETSVEDIRLNLFVTAERSSWNARTFTTFDRMRDDKGGISYQSTIPLYASGVVSQDLSWNARTSFRSNKDVAVNGVGSHFLNEMAGYRVEALKRSAFTLSQNMDVEASQADSMRFLTIAAGLETASTPRFSQSVTLGAAYNVTGYFTSTESISSSTFFDQRLSLRGSYVSSNTLRFDARQTSNYTKGNLVPFSGNTDNSQTFLGQYVSPGSLSPDKLGSESITSITSLSATWSPKPRLTTNITLNEDLYKSESQSATALTEVLASITYTSDTWSATDRLRFLNGNRDTFETSSNTVSNDTMVRYIHSRSFDAAANVSYIVTSSKEGTSSNVLAGQRATYSYFTKTGVARKILEFNETLAFADGPRDSSTELTKSIILGMKYYPISQLTLASGIGYSFNNPFKLVSPERNNYSLVWNASVAANFRLLQASVDYVHGIRKSDGARESKVTGNVRKAF